MMRYAYDPEYLPLVQRVMGDMYDFAVNTLGFSLQEFHKMFQISGMARQLEIANPTYAAGKNGCEVAKLVVEKCCGYTPEQEEVMYLDKSPEYWVGWTLAYYQWHSALDYHAIDTRIPIIEIYGMYATLHEADITKFVDICDERFKDGKREESRLRRLRAYAGLSQKQLSERSGVSLRQIQLFEQGQRDINKTQALTALHLAKTLGCRFEDLVAESGPPDQSS